MSKRDQLKASGFGRKPEQPATWEDAILPPTPPEPEPEPEALVTIACRVTQSEYDRLIALADAADVQYSYIMRHFVLDGLSRVTDPIQLPSNLGPIRKHGKRGKRGKQDGG